VVAPSSSAFVFSIPSAFASANGVGSKAVWPFGSSSCFAWAYAAWASAGTVSLPKIDCSRVDVYSG
jgi:hypothetical protein